jgi:L,D-transpeptidase ErfK/SrfK
MKTCSLFVTTTLALMVTASAHARTFAMPSNPEDNIISEFPDGNPYTMADPGGTLLEVARRFNLGQTEIVQLNPDIDRWLTKEGDIVRLANLRILPDAPHTGIVLNVAETRLYYYPPTAKGRPGVVHTYPVGIGREDWATPLGQTKVIDKIKNPTWRPPEAIRREHAADGDFLPTAVPPGPDNPLGAYALYLGFKGYRIHGTDKPYSIGLRATHGCTRMYPEDIEELFPMIPKGTPVNIINQPVKAGWLNGTLYVEIHPGLEGEELPYAQLYQLALAAIKKANKNQMPIIDNAALQQAVEKGDGIPVAVHSHNGANTPVAVDESANADSTFLPQ